MTTSINHTSFVIERELPGSPRHAFRFWSEHELKRKWTSCHPDWTVLEDSFDFREGGAETVRWRMQDGVELSYRAHYLDIVPAERLIYAYAMKTGARPISASLVTVEFAAKGKATRMNFTEQAVFFDGADAALRAGGTGEGFDRLILAIEASLATAH